MSVYVTREEAATLSGISLDRLPQAIVDDAERDILLKPWLRKNGQLDKTTGYSMNTSRLDLYQVDALKRAISYQCRKRLRKGQDFFGEPHADRISTGTYSVDVKELDVDREAWNVLSHAKLIDLGNYSSGYRGTQDCDDSQVSDRGWFDSRDDGIPI